MSAKRILVTSALPYVNGPLHLGHLAGAYLPADVFCRYHRLRGEDLVFICGSDEHGTAMVMQAFREETTPRAIVDKYHPMVEDTFRRFGMSFDHYGRTTSDTHRETSQEWFAKLAADGRFTVKTSAQPFDPVAGLFLADRFIVGTCPHCSYPEAYGDQCRELRPLPEPEGAHPAAQHPDRRDARGARHDPLVPTDRRSRGLAERVARREGPLEAQRDGSGEEPDEGARRARHDPRPPVGCSGAVGRGRGGGRRPRGEGPLRLVRRADRLRLEHPRVGPEAGRPGPLEDVLAVRDTRLLHFIGKDNIVFHTIIFPTLMKLHGDYVLPENVPANEFLNLEGQKFSTSKRWAVWAHEALAEFEADYLRYALFRVLPETQDADFSWGEFQAHINNELADTLGNFINRTLKFTTQYLDGKVPALDGPGDAETETLAALAGFPARIGALIDGHKYREALMELMALARVGNKYFNDAAPWATRKTDMVACGNTIHVSLQLCASLSVLCDPFLPHMARRMREMLALDGVRPSAPGEPAGTIGWDDAGYSLSPPDTRSAARRSSWRRFPMRWS